SSGVEQAAEELLLARERRRVLAAAVHRIGYLLGFLGELRGAIAARAVAEIVELLRDLPLLPRERALRRLHLRRERRRSTGARHDALRLGVDGTLSLGHVLHLLQHVAEAARGARRVHALAVAGKRCRGLIERVGSL